MVVSFWQQMTEDRGQISLNSEVGILQGGQVRKSELFDFGYQILELMSRHRLSTLPAVQHTPQYALRPVHSAMSSLLSSTFGLFQALAATVPSAVNFIIIRKKEYINR